MRLIANVYALVQEPNGEITQPGHHDEWYAHPVWTLIGIVALVLILVLIARTDRRNKTPVVK